MLSFENQLSIDIQSYKHAIEFNIENNAKLLNVRFHQDLRLLSV